VLAHLLGASSKGGVALTTATATIAPRDDAHDHPPPKPKRATWERHKFDKPLEPRDKWHRIRHEDEAAALVRAGVINRRAYATHMLAITHSNDQLADTDSVTLEDLAADAGVCTRTISRDRALLVKVGLEEHEHRSHRRSNGTFLGRPNGIRFQLPPENAARVAQRREAGRRKRTTPKKDHATPKAPQNDPGAAERRIRARNDARAAGRTCPVCEGTCVVETPDGYIPCDACQRTGVADGFDP